MIRHPRRARTTGRLGAWLATAVLACAPLPAAADQDAPELDTLFDRLEAVEDTERAEPITRKIWEHWRAIDDPEAAAALEQGIAALHAGRHGPAEAYFDQVIAAAPDFAEGWNKRATARYLGGKLADAAADIRRTLQLEPRHFGALSGLGLVYMQLERYRAAITAFERALAINPHLAGTRRNLAIARERLRESTT